MILSRITIPIRNKPAPLYLANTHFITTFRILTKLKYSIWPTTRAKYFVYNFVADRHKHKHAFWIFVRKSSREVGI